MLSEDLVTLALVLSEDPKLRAWFLALEKLAPPDRAQALHTLAIKMQAGGEDPTIVSTISSVTHPEVFSALVKTLHEVG